MPLRKQKGDKKVSEGDREGIEGQNHPVIAKSFRSCITLIQEKLQIERQEKTKSIYDNILRTAR